MTIDLIAYLQEHIAQLHLVTCNVPFHEENVVKKISIKPVLIKEVLHFQVVTFEETRCLTKNILADELVKSVQSYLKEYSVAFLRFSDAELSVTVSPDGRYKVKKKLLKLALEHDLSHNRKKNHILEEGVFLEWLYELGIQRKDGTIVASSRDKFRQVNRFLEFVQEILPALPENPHIIDVGSGKGYLTFALYHFLQSHDKTPHIVGIDLKENVVESGNKLAQKVGFESLHFKNLDIEKFIPDTSVDLVISLHACNKATCLTLAKAVLWQAKAILVAPCCQQEVNGQIQVQSFEVMLKHGLFKERFSAIFTDALRVRLLEVCGYKVDVIEFVDPEHTPKNLLIRAKKTQSSINFKLLEEYKTITKEFGISIYFERLLESFLKNNSNS